MRLRVAALAGEAVPGSDLVGVAVFTLCTQFRCSRVSGNTSRSADQKPSAPSPTASTGARMPRRLQSRSRSAQLAVDSRCPSTRATSSFFPSARTPTTTSVQTRSSSRRTLKYTPSTHT